MGNYLARNSAAIHEFIGRRRETLLESKGFPPSEMSHDRQYIRRSIGFYSDGPQD